MRLGSTLCVWLALACNSDEPIDGGTIANVDPLEVGTDPEDTDLPPLAGCFADVVMDLGDDGTVDGTGLDLYDPARHDLLVHAERDSAVLGTSARDFTYDTSGYLVHVEIDEGVDGALDYVATYTRDANGLLLSSEVDDGGEGAIDGILDEIRTYTWTDSGDLATYARDRDGNGDPDYAAVYTYDNGLRVSGTEDRDGDEVMDVTSTYTYDAALRVTLVESDSADDGSIDLVVTTTYTDPILLVGSTVMDEDNDGDADFSDTFAYDAEGRLLSQVNDEGADGFIDFVGTWTYTSAGLLATSDEETFTPPPNDHFMDWIRREYTYDAQSRVVDQLTDGAFVDDLYTESRLARLTWTFGGDCL